MLIPPHRADLPPRSEAEQQAFYSRIRDLAVQAENVAGREVEWIEIAGQTIQLIFAGAGLTALLMPALAHRRTSARGQTADVLTIHVWDSAGSGIAICDPPVERYCFSERGDIWTMDSQRVRSAFHYSDYSLNLMDCLANEAVFWVEDARHLPNWTRAAPFRTLFHWFFERRGAQLVHGAAVGKGGRGVLITGTGGAGKSSTSLQCHARGFDFVGDDYVLITADGGLRAHNLYCSAKLLADDVDRFPALGSTPPPVGDRDGKHIVAIERGIVDSLPIDIILTPRFGSDRESRFEPVNHDHLLGSACFTTIAQLPHAGPQTGAFISRALGSVPARELVLGTDRDGVVDAVAGLLTDLPTVEARPPIEQKNVELISVIIPVFNGAHFLSEAVASIRTQGYPLLEIIVVDDGSSDDLAGAAAALPVQVRLVHQENQGPAAARNLGIRAASGGVIAFLDVDDLWPAQKLAQAFDWLKRHPETDVVIGRAQLHRIEAEGVVQSLGSPAESFGDYIGAALFRRRAFDQAGLFDPLLRFAEDSDWFARAQHFGVRIDRVDMVMLDVRRHGSNTTSGRDARELSPIRLLRNRLEWIRAGEAGS
jgi:hypothetical protein